ncbi:MAG: phosphate ABC transporter ATP-binding protein, partial [Pseudomonadota bacterium]
QDIPETIPARPLIEVDRLNLWYGQTHALKDVSFDIHPGEILAFIGPSGCGKSTALKCLNRMHDDTRGVRMQGSIRMGGEDIHTPDLDVPRFRSRFGWVAQKPNPFPTSIYNNVAYGARIQAVCNTRAELDALVERCLRRAFLWEETKDMLHSQKGTDLSGGQQQRLCVARALAVEPEVMLMDEPTGSIDPVATGKLEELMMDLGRDHAVIVITHSMMEAKRISNRVAYFHLGRLLEISETEAFFAGPRTAEARAFIEGRFG